uniref:Uncharacterized protein n=1 Tax=Clastoptera arizonana TaxID=38151 RepID=A0A1B6DW17_9HEMI
MFNAVLSVFVVTSVWYVKAHMSSSLNTTNRINVGLLLGDYEKLWYEAFEITGEIQYECRSLKPMTKERFSQIRRKIENLKLEVIFSLLTLKSNNISSPDPHFTTVQGILVGMTELDNVYLRPPTDIVAIIHGVDAKVREMLEFYIRYDDNWALNLFPKYLIRSTLPPRTYQL